MKRTTNQVIVNTKNIGYIAMTFGVVYLLLGTAIVFLSLANEIPGSLTANAITVSLLSGLLGGILLILLGKRLVGATAATLPKAVQSLRGLTLVSLIIVILSFSLGGVGWFALIVLGTSLGGQYSIKKQQEGK